MKQSRLVLTLVAGLALPLAASAAGVPTIPLPANGMEITPIEHVYQQQQMAERGMRTGAQGSAGTSLFERLDTNRDGFISAAESDTSSMVRRDFQTLDRNTDGLISRDEWKAGGGM